jgi:hypothetical protein
MRGCVGYDREGRWYRCMVTVKRKRARNGVSGEVQALSEGLERKRARRATLAKKQAQKIMK